MIFSNIIWYFQISYDISYDIFKYHMIYHFVTWYHMIFVYSKWYFTISYDIYNIIWYFFVSYDKYHMIFFKHNPYCYYSCTPIYRAPIYRADRFTVNHPFPPIFFGKFLDLKIKFSNEKSIFFKRKIITFSDNFSF